MLKCTLVVAGIALFSTSVLSQQQQATPEDSPTPQELTAAVRQQFGEAAFANSSLQAQVKHLSDIVAKLRAENEKLKAAQQKPDSDKKP